MVLMAALPPSVERGPDQLNFKLMIMNLFALFIR